MRYIILITQYTICQYHTHHIHFSKIYHPNVVLFLGACTQMGKMQIVTERCTTDLEKLLASKYVWLQLKIMNNKRVRQNEG